MQMSGATARNTPFIEVRGVSKTFGHVAALKNVTFDVMPGEVHCVVGENGAGKSTLMNTLYGFNKPDSGAVYVQGSKVQIDSPSAALKLHIGMVHQHLMLVPNLSVIENIALGQRENVRSSAPNGIRARVLKLADRLGIKVELDRPVGELALGQRQQVEILKTLVRGARLVILDEPTSVLSPLEIEKLGQLMRAIAGDGAGVVLITHKLREAIEFSDRITVMRAGEVVSSGASSAYDRREIVRLMFGSAPQENAGAERPRMDAAPPGKPHVVVRDLRVLDGHRNVVVDDMSFVIRSGEILGVAGVSGNGQSQLCEAIAGMRQIAGGSILLREREIASMGTRDRRNVGLAYIPEERRDGMAMELTVRENLYLNQFGEKDFVSFGVMKQAMLNKKAEDLGRRYAVPATRLGAQTRLLSGGNQQRIAVAKALDSGPNFVVASQPTIGLDIRTIEFIQSSLLHLRDRGAAILYVSTELEELFAIADRIAVMYRGKLAKILNPFEYSREVIGPLMITGGGMTQ